MALCLLLLLSFFFSTVTDQISLLFISISNWRREIDDKLPIVSSAAEREREGETGQRQIEKLTEERWITSKCCILYYIRRYFLFLVKIVIDHSFEDITLNAVWPIFHSVLHMIFVIIFGYLFMRSHFSCVFYHRI